MKEVVPFKTRVKNTIIQAAQQYNDYLVGYDFLIYSSKFTNREVYIVSPQKTNFLHLTGVRTSLSPIEFFNKCIAQNTEEQLSEDDFHFNDDFGNVDAYKGTVREKIQVILNMKDVFSSSSTIEENFKKGKVACVLAAENNSLTLGFSGGQKTRPKTLMKGNQLSKPLSINLIMKKRNSEQYFKTVIGGDINYFVMNVTNDTFSLIDNSFR